MPDKKKDQAKPDKDPKSWRRILFNRWLLIGVAALILYALLGFFLAPRLISSFVSDFSKETLNRQASITEVRVNPFSLTLDAKGFALKELDGRPILGFGRLFVNFELSSLFRWAWTFADIRLEEPSLHMDIREDGRLNFAVLADSLPKSKEPPPEDSPPPRLVIQHVDILNGSFTFSDRSDITPAEETFFPINLEFKEISTLPERKGPYTIRADLPGGGTIGWKGEVSLQPLSSEGHLSMTGFKLATAWEFVQDELRISEPRGEASFRTFYRFDYLEHTPQLICKDGYFKLTGLELVEKNPARPLVALETLEFSNVGFDLKNQSVTIPEIRVHNGKIAASVNKKGVLNWQTLVIPKKLSKQAAPAPPEETTTNRPWRLTADAAAIENVALDYRDNSRVNPLALAVGGVNLSLNATAEVGGGDTKAALDSLKVKLTKVALSAEGNDTPLITLDTFALDGGKVDIGKRAVILTQMAISGGKTNMVRDKEGRIHLLEAFHPADRGLLKEKIAEVGEKARAEGKPWSFSLDAFELNGYNLALEDRTMPPAVVYNFKDIRATLNNISNDGKTPIDFDAELKVVQGGKAQFSGQVGQAGGHADAKIKISGLSLKPLQPAVANFTTLALKSGSISASAKLKYESAESGPKVSADGAVSVDRLRLNEAATGERVLEWKSLSASGINFGLSPDRLRIRKVRLQQPGVKMVVYKDRSFNLAKMVKSQDTDKAKKTPPTASSRTSKKRKKQTEFPVKIQSVRVEKGVVDFSDLSLILPFATHVTDFKGGIVDISSSPKNRATVKFDGRVDKYGLATVEGRLSPFAPKTFTDLKVAFQNVKLTPLTPYTATFAGRKIASGTLNLNLGYKIQNSELLGDNSVILDQFTLGERVEAPDAVSLPLDLAIALLTDTEGKIDVAVPVRGNLDDPQFSYGHVVWQAVINLITKAVTAPFRALGNLFGGKGEQVNAIAFNPGSDQLLPPEQEKLAKVAKALEKRPQLRLVVLGRFDPEVDGKALRTHRVRLALADQMGEKIAPDEGPEPILFDNAKTQRTLEKLLKKRAGDEAVSSFQARYEKTAGKEVKRVNPALGLFGVESPDTAFYEALFDELVKLEPLNEKPLQYLAQKRAEAIVEDLKANAGLDEARLAVGDSAPVEKPSQETIKTQLQLDVLKPAAN